MAKIKYSEYPGLTYRGSIGIMSFTLSPNPKGKWERRVTTRWLTCRDHINDVLIGFNNEETHLYHEYGKDPDFDMAKLRLLVAAPKNKKPFIFTAKRILNVYEKLAGFSSRSKITTVEVENLDSAAAAWLITGPGEWMKCSQLVSMCTLISRCCGRIEKEQTTFKDIDGVEKYWKTSIETYPGLSNYFNWDITTALPFCYPKWRVLMENFDSLFEGLTTKELYPLSQVGSWHGPGGIFNLCSHTSKIDKLDDRFKEACKKAKIKVMKVG